MHELASFYVEFTVVHPCYDLKDGQCQRVSQHFPAVRSPIARMPVRQYRNSQLDPKAGISVGKGLRGGWGRQERGDCGQDCPISLPSASLRCGAHP